MAHLIDKDALVAEIERRRDLHYKYYMKNGAGSIAECKYDEDKDILSFLDALEVKEVELEKELDRIWFDNKFGNMFDNSAVDFANVREICKHFFELGLQAQKGE